MKNFKNIYKMCFLFLAITFLPNLAEASSHREAPLISNDPLADNADLYAFRSPDNPDMITIIATYIPMQLPHGGPNYYTFGENIRYEIHVDNDPNVSGDEITYRFTFTQVNEDPTTFFNIRLGKQNLKTTYTLERSMDGGMTFQTIVQDGIVPPNNIGERSIESPVGLGTTYSALFNGAITQASTGESVYAGPSDDPFFVDLAGIFDLGDAPIQNGDPRDALQCYNVSAIAIQVPISTLRNSNAATTPTNILDSDYIIGVWASASRPSMTTLSASGNPTFGGDWVQVSRLGMPLTNEAVIPIGSKDFWNSITPYDEINETTLDQYFYNPELALYMDDDQFGSAVPALGPLRIQTNSLGAFDFTNGADGLFSLKGTPAVAGTALDDAIFGSLLLPGPGLPRSVDLWPAFHTGVPNFPPYQLATGKDGNPLASGKPFVNNFLPNGGDMLRLNMAVPPTPRNDVNFSSLGLIQAAAIGLTVAPFNESADLEFIPNMDGFPNGRRLEDDVTRIELQAVGGVVLAAIGLWYDDYDPSTSPSPVTDDLLNVLTYSTGVETNDVPFQATFPYVAMPFSGTGNCSGEVINVDIASLGKVFVSSNTASEVGVFDIWANNSLQKSTFPAEALDADGIFYDQERDLLFQLNRSANRIDVYEDIDNSIQNGDTPPLLTFSTSDFINGREIAVFQNQLVVAQDANDANGQTNKFYIYNISGTTPTLTKVYDASINLWGIHADGTTLYAIEDNSNRVAVFNDFFNQPAGAIDASSVIEVEGLVRTHGITYDFQNDLMYLTDVGAASSPDDGAVVIVDDFMAASQDGMISSAEQVRIAGPNSFLGNPVDIAFSLETNDFYVVERANGGGRLLAFDIPTASGDVAPKYNESFAGASGIYIYSPQNVGPPIGNVFVASNTSQELGVFGIQSNNTLSQSNFAVEAMDADGIFYDKDRDLLYQLNRTSNRIDVYDNVDAALQNGSMLSLVASSTSDFINGREIAVFQNQLVVAQDANDANGQTNKFYIYDISGNSPTLTKVYDASINLWGIHADGTTLYAIEDNSNRMAVFNDFFNQPAGAIDASSVIEVEGLVRTHGITYDFQNDLMYLTDVGAASSPDDGAVVIVDDFMAASQDGMISSAEQVRIAGPNSFLGNPVDIAFSLESNDFFVAERANGGGRLLAFDVPTTSGNFSPKYNELFPGASAVYILSPENNINMGTGADVSLSVEPDNILYTQYETTVFSVVVKNDGPESTDDVEVKFPLPVDWKFTDAATSKGEYELFFETWYVGALAAGEEAILELELFSKTEDGPVLVYAEVINSTTSDPDSEPGNGNGTTANEDDESAITLTSSEDGGTTGTDGTADLSLTIDGPIGNVDLYVPFDLNFTVTNDGPDVATGVVVNVPKPQGLAYTDDFTSSGSYNLFERKWKLDDLAPGASATLEITWFTKLEADITQFSEVFIAGQDDPDSSPANGNGVTPMEDDEAIYTINVINALAPDQAIFRANGPIVNEVYPNPTQDFLSIVIESEIEGQYGMEIFDLAGGEQIFKMLDLVKGKQFVNMDVSMLPPGIYYMRVFQTGLVTKFIVAK